MSSALAVLLRGVDLHRPGARVPQQSDAGERGHAFRKSSIHLPAKLGKSRKTPVTLPPGRADALGIACRNRIGFEVDGDDRQGTRRRARRLQDGGAVGDEHRDLLVESPPRAWA